MDIHSYDENGEYLSTIPALESPLEPGVFLIPRNATTQSPPEKIEGFARLFSGGSWQQVLDKRGMVYWMGHDDRRVISSLGEDFPEGALMERPLASEPELVYEIPVLPSKEELLTKIAELQAQINALQG
jgi:hypothetical protein